MGVPFTFLGVEETKVLNITNYAYKIKQIGELVTAKVMRSGAFVITLKFLSFIKNKFFLFVY